MPGARGVDEKRLVKGYKLPVIKWVSSEDLIGSWRLQLIMLQSKGGVHNKLLQTGPPLSVSGGSFPHAHLPGSKCPPAEERRLSMPETGEKERNCLFKSYTDLE